MPSPLARNSETQLATFRLWTLDRLAASLGDPAFHSHVLAEKCCPGRGPNPPDVPDGGDRFTFARNDLPSYRDLARRCVDYGRTSALWIDPSAPFAAASQGSSRHAVERTA